MLGIHSGLAFGCNLLRRARAWPAKDDEAEIVCTCFGRSGIEDGCFQFLRIRTDSPKKLSKGFRGAIAKLIEDAVAGHDHRIAASHSY